MPNRTNQARHASACQVAGPAKTDKEHLRKRFEDLEKRGYRLPLDDGRLGASLADHPDGPVRQNIGHWARATGSDSPSLGPLSPASEVRSLEFVW